MTQRSEALKEAICAAAKEVWSVLGPGHEESVYHEALAVDFKKRGVHYEAEKNMEVLYKGTKVGTHRVDLIVEGSILVELKSVQSLTDAHEWQTRAYLRNTGLGLAVLINFPRSEVELEIKYFEVRVEPRPIPAMRGKW